MNYGNFFWGGKKYVDSQGLMGIENQRKKARSQGEQGGVGLPNAGKKDDSQGMKGQDGQTSHPNTRRKDHR